MLRKTFDKLFQYRLLAYFSATAIAGLLWGFVPGLMALGFTWAAIKIAGNILLSNIVFPQMPNKGLSESLIDNEDNIPENLFDDNENPAEWVKRKTDEYLYGSSYSHMPGNMWHHSDS